MVAAEEQPLTEYVAANGMVDYDPTTYAHIATRAPGTVWWVGKQIGQPTRKGEVLALVERAQPLPAFPPSMAEDHLDLTVPIRFSLR